MKNRSLQKKIRHQFVCYCSRCRWGFTAKAVAISHFCPRCGRKVQRAFKQGDGRHRGTNERNGNWEISQGIKDGVHYNAKPNSMSSASKNDGRLIGKLTRIKRMPDGRQCVAYARQHPMTVGAGTAFTGAGLICAAPATLAVGAGIAATGAAIAGSAATIGVFVAILSMLAGGSMEGMMLGMSIIGVGMGIGGAFSIAGGLTMAAGGAMAATGTFLSYGGGTLFAAASAKRLHSWEKENGRIGEGLRRLSCGMKQLLPAKPPTPHTNEESKIIQLPLNQSN